MGELRVVNLGVATARVHPLHVLGLRHKRGKLRPRQKPLGFLAGQTANTEWGPAVLVEECEEVAGMSILERGITATSG